METVAAAPDWRTFRERFKAGDGRARILARVRQMETWLDLAMPQALSEAQQALSGLSEADARAAWSAVPLKRLQIVRDAGLPGDDAAIHALFAKCNAGTATPAEFAVGLQLANTYQIGDFLLKTYPAVTSPLTPEQQNAQNTAIAEILAVSDRLFPLMARSHAGSVTPESIDQFVQIAAELLVLQQKCAGDKERLFACDQLARAHYWRALNLALLGRYDESKDAYRECAKWFAAAGDPEKADDARRHVSDLEIGVSGDTDAIAKQALASAIAAESSADGFALAGALAANCTALSEAGDHFERKRVAETLTAQLLRLHFLDPQQNGWGAAVDSWVANIPDEYGGTEFLRRLYAVKTAWLAVLGARCDENVNSPAAAQLAYDFMTGDEAQALLPEMVRQEQQATDELRAAWSKLLPPQLRTDKSNEKLPLDQLDQQGAFARFDAEWLAVQRENESRDADAREDLLKRADGLDVSATALGVPLFIAKAKLIRGQVLIAAGRSEEAVTALSAGRDLLRSANPSSSGTLINSAERGFQLMLLKDLAAAYAALGDSKGVSTTCDEAIGLIEGQRYLVSSPERQSAFLDWRVDFYRYGIAAARKLGDWDKMLERIELVKARSLLRTRLTGDIPHIEETEVSAEFRRVSDALQKDGANSDLLNRRRQLWDLLSIARMRERTNSPIPELNVRSVQEALDPDEGAIEFYWATETVLLACVFTSDSFHLEKIDLDASAAELYSDFTAAMETLDSFNAEMDDAVAELGRVLLPPAIREPLNAKKRLLISPHQSLHVFPFQAVPWNGGFIGQRFALRYAPNLSSLLLPRAQSAANDVLALGVREFASPPFSSNPLPLAEQEATDVAMQYTDQGCNAHTLTGLAASRSAFAALRDTGELQTFRWLHLATHGTSVFANDTRDHPMESKLILQDGCLDGLEIADLRLSADLVVLSACNSGQRAVAGRGMTSLPGDDVFGLQSAFFASGVNSVLGALWPLKDEPAFDLMRRFHQEHAAGVEADEALRRAVDGYLRAGQRIEIFYWAALFLIAMGKEKRTDGKADDSPASN